jgi:DNA invertase Pin-like site-specific DNA recombinase
MLIAASRPEFDLVLFWSLDRFSLEGVLETLQHLQLLSSYGVEWRSFTEQYLDSCGMFKDAVLSILATIAKQEPLRISERTLAGLEHAKAKGKLGAGACMWIRLASQNCVRPGSRSPRLHRRCRYRGAWRTRRRWRHEGRHTYRHAVSNRFRVRRAAQKARIPEAAMSHGRSVACDSSGAAPDTVIEAFHKIHIDHSLQRIK